MNLQPLGDRLIVRSIEAEDVTASGIVLPDTAKEKPQKGKVLAVGDGKVNEDTGKRTIEEVSAFLGLPPDRFVEAADPVELDQRVEEDRRR